MSIVVIYCIVSFIALRFWPAGTLLGRTLTVRAFLFLLLLLLPLVVQAQDTVKVLEQVEVSTQRTPSTLTVATPTQVVDAARIEEQGAMQLSDVVRQMAGVTLKDYGGVGGMKTVSARGLGSQFSTVTIDGIAISDAQNGQVDLGRYLLGNAAYVSLSHGQQQGSLLSARAYAAGNVLNLETATPMFYGQSNTNLKIGLEGGSYRMLSPSVLWEQRWGRRLRSSLWMDYLRTAGDYPFTLYYTTDHSGQTSRERRRHSAMQMFTTDASLFYTVRRGNEMSLKVHHMQGMHQLPGPVQLYNQRVSAQNTRERVSFVQYKWRVDGNKWESQLLGKLQSTYDFYEDSAANTLTGYQMNDYLQREAYLSGSAVWHLLPWLDLSGAADGSAARLNTNLAQRNDVHRDNLMAVAALRLHHADTNMNRVELNANLLGTTIRDRVADLDTMPLFSRLSPFVGLNITVLGHTTLRYFYKETFRAPNFSELYFFALPRDLRPERARQHNVGVTYAGDFQLSNSSLQFSTTLDVYYNRVVDKILAIPTQNMFLWSMQNLGRAEIFGVDATADFGIEAVSMQLNYSYQRALDRTDPASRTYGHQIAYTPRHSGGAAMRWENRWVNLGATAMVVGERYYMMQNSDDTRMPAYCDLGLTADRLFRLKQGMLRLSLQVLNLADVQYEVVRSYPMMGRNFRMKIMYEF